MSLGTMLASIPRKAYYFNSCTIHFCKLSSKMEKKAAGFIVYRIKNKEFEFLLLKASYGKKHWTPPKGHLDPGETDLEAAFRETKEEAGFDKSDLRVIHSFHKVLKYSADGIPKSVVYWLAELICDKPVVLSAEHTEYKWSKFAEACHLATYSDFNLLLEDCVEFLREHHLQLGSQKKE